jgi:hypothetical protein
MATDNIYPREMARRKAFWELARFTPGDPMAAGTLAILDAIELEDSHNSHLADPVLTVDEVASSVPEESLPTGIWIVREAGIPQPWLERFRCASVGSTRVAEGPYATDWEKFLRKWKKEMVHLEEHRSVRAKRG